VNTQTDKPVVNVAIGGFDGFLTECLFGDLFAELMGERASLNFIEFQHADPLLDAWWREDFDLFIVFFNPNIRFLVSCGDEDRFSDLRVLTRLKATAEKPVVVIHNGVAGHSAEAIRRAGADAVFGMPFSRREFGDAVKACLHDPATG
jgi:hypothetical protein